MDNYHKYLKYKTKYLKVKNNLVGGSSPTFYFGQDTVDNNNHEITIYLFKAEWCGHCKSFRETWNTICNTLTDPKGPHKEHSTKINFITYDSNTHKDEIKQWDIKGFPTIMIRRDKNAQEYTGDRDMNSFITFILSLLKNN